MAAKAEMKSQTRRIETRLRMFPRDAEASCPPSIQALGTRLARTRGRCAPPWKPDCNTIRFGLSAGFSWQSSILTRTRDCRAVDHVRIRGLPMLQLILTASNALSVSRRARLLLDQARSKAFKQEQQPHWALSERATYFKAQSFQSLIAGLCTATCRQGR